MKLYCIIALSLLLRPETAAAQQEELTGWNKPIYPARPVKHRPQP